MPLDVTCIAWRDRCATHTHTHTQRVLNSVIPPIAAVRLTWRHAAVVAAALAVQQHPRTPLQTQGMEHLLKVGNVGRYPLMVGTPT